MPRPLASALTAALIAGVSIVPGPWSPAAAAEEPAPPPTAITLAGGGRGASGPASRALLKSYSRIDAAPDGTLLVEDGVQLMRVDPARDSLTVIPWPDVTGAWGISDVAADGSSVVLATANNVKRIARDGTVTQLWERSGIAALDVGSDHVVWAVQDTRVHRVLPDGTSTATAAGALVEPVDITVTPDGKKAYVLDIGSGHRGVFEVTAAGVGARVAGNLTAGGYFQAGVASTEANTAEARSLTTDGTTITLSSPYHEKVLSFPVGGGTLTQVASGPCAYAVARLGADVVAACVTGPGEASLRRYSAAGIDRGRILGADPAQPWSPDGVRATDAYLGAVRGSAGLPDGSVVLTTEHGLVREVDADGRLRTRARLAPLAKRGKVALGADRTAYVVTDSGGVAAVTPAGAVTTVVADADAVDVEVLADGALAIADASGARILRVPTTGPAAVLTDSIGTPVDLARQGDRLLVADGGLRRVDLTGAVSTVLSGGRPTMVTATDDGVWSNPDDGWGDVMVISPDGGMRPVAATGGPVAQLQAVGDGSVLRGGGETVSRITSPNLGASIPALTLTVTPGPGRITLDWGKPYAEVTVVAKRGTEAPRDRWDGAALPMYSGRPESNVVMLIGGEPLTPGEDWSFAAFEHGYTTNGTTSSRAWSPAGTAVAAALEDSTPPPAPTDVVLTPDRSRIQLSYLDPNVDDFSHSVVRYALGSTPPSGPTDGLPFPLEGNSWHYGDLPEPVRDQDYAVAIFVLDHQGNVATWSAVTRLDFEPPAQVSAVAVNPFYRGLGFSFTAPGDGDYSHVRYAVVPAGQVSDLSASTSSWGTAQVINDGLAMDTDYELALWSVDKAGNTSAPVLTPFRTLLDSTPPAMPADLAVAGGDYQVTATWTPPTDADLKSQTAVLTDLATGVKTTASPVGKTTSTYTWSRLPGGHTYSVEVFATDVNGLTSAVAKGEARTADDTNGPPLAIALRDITVTPASSSSVTVSFPRPAIPDLKGVSYDVRPVGADPDPITTLYGLPTSSATVRGTIWLPTPMTAYELIIYVFDHNGNRVRTIVPSVIGAPNPSELPAAPNSLMESTPRDNTIDVTWGKNTSSAPVTSWRLTATSGALTRTITVDGSARAAQFSDLAGRVSWKVAVLGVNAFGPGPATVSPDVMVTDTTAPQLVTGATRTSSYSTDVVSWTNPKDFDFHHVDVTRYGATSAETKLVYRGAGTRFTSTGLVAGRPYTYLIRAYDTHGQTATTSVRLDTLRAAPSIAAPTTLTYGGSARVSGVLRWNGGVLGGRSVALFAQRVGTTTWSTVASTTTSSTGTYAFSAKPAVNTRYKVGYLGSGSAGGAESATVTVGVAPSVSIAASRTSLYYGGTATFSTTVRPGHAGRSIILQRWSGTAWVTVTSRALSSTSTASVTIKPTARGTVRYRWMVAAHTDHLTGASAVRYVKVY